MGEVNKKIKKLMESSREALCRSTERLGLCFDGVVDEETYNNPLKVAFLLKEANLTNEKEKSEDWDYADWLNYNQLKGNKRKDDDKEYLYSTFRNVCMWMALLDDVKNKRSTTYADYTVDKTENGYLDIERIRIMMSRVAVINLKKTWGGSSTRWSDLNYYLTDIRDGQPDVINADIQRVLVEEIEYINPDIVLCGGVQVYDFAKKIFNDATESEHVGGRLRYFKYNGARFVCFRHPACRGKRKANFEYAKQIFDELCNY